MKLTFIGTGYVGLVSGVMMSYLGHHVTCIDIDAKKIELLKTGKPTIYEEDLELYMKACTEAGRLDFKLGYDESLSDQEAFFVTVGTPPSDTGAADLSEVYSAIDSILEVANQEAIIVIKSTVPPGTSIDAQNYVYSKGKNLEVTNNPEFLREGTAVKDFLLPDRIVVGSSSSESADKLRRIYSPMLDYEIPSFRLSQAQEDFIPYLTHKLPFLVNLDKSSNDDQQNQSSGQTKLNDDEPDLIPTEDLLKTRINRNLSPKPYFVSTDPTTSEMIKYASNSFLANKIAFINEMSDLCEGFGANIKDLSFAVGLDQRIGTMFLKAGPGFGGSCFPKDIIALQYLAHENKVNSLILDAVIEANKNRPFKMVRKINEVLSGIKGKKIAIMGLTYKANTDDFRNSPALSIVDLIKQQGGIITVFDPMSEKLLGSEHNLRSSLGFDSNLLDNQSSNTMNFELIVESNEIAQDPIEASKVADAIVFLTEWEQFQDINWERLKETMNTPCVIDLRNFLDSKRIRENGLLYYSIGSK